MSVSSESLERWIQDNVGYGRPYSNVNRLLNEALKRLRAEIEGLEHQEITFDSEPISVTESQIKELKAEMGAKMVIDCLPPVPPGDHPKAVHMSIRHEDARLIDELITLPGMAGRTRADVIRSLTFVGLKALDEVRKIDSPAWKTQLALAEAPIIRSNRKLNEEMLAAAVKNLRDDLLELCFQDRWEDAWDEWRNFYEQFVKMNWFLQQAALWSLRTMPISQLLVRKFSAHVPDDFPVPEADPPSLSLHTDIGVYKPGMALGIEMPNSNVTLNAPLQFLIGAPSGSS